MSWIEDPGIADFRGFNISQLGLDQAWINVTSLVEGIPLWIYELSSDCHKCPYEKKTALNFSEPYNFIVSTKFPMKYRFRTRGDGETYVKESGNDSYKFCDIDQNFGEFGVYNIQLGGSQRNPECRVDTALDPVNIYYPLLLAFLFYLIFGLLFLLVSTGHTRVKLWLKSSSSGSSSKTSSSSVDNNPAGGGGAGGGAGGENVIVSATPLPQHPSQQIYGVTASSSNGVRRLSTASGSGVSVGVNPQYGQVGNNGVYGYNPNYAPVGVAPGASYSPTATTEVSISTISSTPTSTAVTTYGKPHHHQQQGMSSSIESPSTNPAVRMPINPTISNNSTSSSTHNPNNNNNNHTSQNQPQSQPSRQQKRLRSLDTFRGMCILVMIFVNDGGAGYYFFGHATWDGLYIADLVFPWFLWIMGVCIPVSIKSQVKRGNSRWTIFKRIFIRSCKLILIGILLGSLWGPVDINTMRIPGVLQRFGICYFVCCTLVLFCMTVNITKPEASKIRAILQDVQIIWIAWILVLLLVLTHCMLTFFLEVPGCPTGYLGPGGLHDYFYEPYQTIGPHCIGGAAGYIDKEVIQKRHIYQWPTTIGTYKSEAYDPEGLLGMLTSIFQVFLGVQTGVTMLVYPRASSRLKRWLAWAVVTGALGALLCGCKQTGGWIPLNKNLWSLSFVLVTNCFALLLLAFLYFIIDIKRWWSGSPFFEPGMNSILLYVGHSVANSMLPWHYVYGTMRTHFARLIESLWGTSLWAVIAIYLYQKKTFWTL